MPTFVDCHPLTAVAIAVVYQMHLEAVRGLVDASGTRPLSHWIDDVALYCVVQAPDEQAVWQHHAQRGLACDDLHRITGLRGSWPLSAEEKRLVRAAMAELWHAGRRAPRASPARTPPPTRLQPLWRAKGDRHPPGRSAAEHPSTARVDGRP